MKTYKFVENILSPDRQDYIEEYAKFQQCDPSKGDLAKEGGKVCKKEIPIAVGPTLKSFTSPSGHYLIDFDGFAC